MSEKPASPETTPKPLPDLTKVKLKYALLPAGSIGTIVYVHANGEAYEVEFEGRGVLTIELNYLEAI